METGIHNTSEIGRLKKVLLHRPGQAPQVLDPPLRGGVRAEGPAIFLQCHALDLHEAGARRRLQPEVEPGVLPAELRPQGREARQEPPRRRPLPKDLVGGLGVHVDEQGSLFHGDEII